MLLTVFHELESTTQVSVTDTYSKCTNLGYDNLTLWEASFNISTLTHKAFLHSDEDVFRFVCLGSSWSPVERKSPGCVMNCYYCELLVYMYEILSIFCLPLFAFFSGILFYI